MLTVGATDCALRSLPVLLHAALEARAVRARVPLLGNRFDSRSGAPATLADGI